MPIPVLNVTPLGHYANGLPYFDFGCDLPLVKVLEEGYSTEKDAYDEAKKWSLSYEKEDPLHMASPIGVTKRDNKFFGVVNYWSI